MLGARQPMNERRFRISDFGRRFTRQTGALELMDDLGRAIGGETDIAFLGGGNPAKIPAVQALVRRRLLDVADDPGALGRMVSNYAHPAGDPPFRRALAKLLEREYGWPLTEDHIALTAGSQASFFLLFNLFAGRGADGAMRRLLLPMTPEYVGYADVGLEDGLIAARRPAIERTSDRSFKYRIDFADLDITGDVGAVCVSRPANPTGNVLTDAELGRLDAACRSARVPLIVDGAYGLPFPSIVFGAAEPLWNENVILCLSLSKLGLPGVRTGIVVAHPEVVEALTSMTAVLNLAVGSVGPVLAQPWVENGKILELGRRTVMPYYRDKAMRARETLERELADVPALVHEPEGAFFLWLWLPGLPITSAELYRRLKAAGVLVLPGHYFFPGLDEPWPHRDECVRISYAQDDDVVERGVKRLAREVRAAFDSTDTPPRAVRIAHAARTARAVRTADLRSSGVTEGPGLEPASERQAASAVLMIRPRRFGANAETADTNRFQASPHAGDEGDAAKAGSEASAARASAGDRTDKTRAAARDGATTASAAAAEHDALASALARAGVEVHVLEGRDEPACPDEIFPNNWFTTHSEGLLVLYPMMAPSRRLERRDDIAAKLERCGHVVRRVVDLTELESRGLFVEGTGSLVLDRIARFAFACLSPRTSLEAVQAFCHRVGYEPLVFDARDREGHPIYHTNVMMSVGTEHAVVCGDAFQDRTDRLRVIELLRARGKQIIEIGFPQLHSFAANILELRGGRGSVIALSRRAHASLEPRQLGALAEHGELVAAPVDTIETFGGGGVRCMLAEVHLPRN